MIIWALLYIMMALLLPCAWGISSGMTDYKTILKITALINAVICAPAILVFFVIFADPSPL